MKIQILYVIIIFSCFVFENYLLAAAKRKISKRTKQELLLENARLAIRLSELESKHTGSNKITASGTISEDEIVDTYDLELGQASKIRRHRSGSTISIDKEDIDIQRSTSDAITVLSQTQSMQHTTQQIIAKVLESNIRYQEKETSYSRRTRKITWIATGATFAYATAGFIMTNWSRISSYINGKNHGTPGSGTNSTGI